MTCRKMNWLSLICLHCAGCCCGLCSKEANLLMLRSRYSNMYIPSDFFHAALLWSDAFPIHRPFKLGRQACQFHVMDKEIEAPDRKQLESLLEPHDADHSFSAKVVGLYDVLLGLIVSSKNVNANALRYFLRTSRNYTVSKKTSPTFLSVTWKPIIRFW